MSWGEVVMASPMEESRAEAGSVAVPGVWLWLLNDHPLRGTL